MISAYFIHLAIIVGIYLILALSLQLSVGYSGILNLAHIAFYGIGAYTSALLVLNGVSFLLAFVIAGVTAMFFALLLSIFISKLKGDYLALSTLAFSFVFYVVAMNWVSLTRGPLGLPGIPKPVIFGFSFADNFSFLVLVAVIGIVTYLVIRKIVDSPFGRVLEATRDDELAVKILGKNTFWIKSKSLMISSFFAGIAGSLYAHYITFIDPSSFHLMQLIPILTIVIIGGLATLRGTIIATIILTLLPEPLRFIGFPSTIIGPARQILYSLVLILILIYKPKGFYGRVDLE